MVRVLPSLLPAGWRCLVFALAVLLPVAAQTPATPNLLGNASFDFGTATYVPWAGVDDRGQLHGNEGRQIMVNDVGAIVGGKFAPSAAVGDLNGDGLPDIVMADTRGFFWYFPNVGTPKAPAFKEGEIIPIWLGEERGPTNNEGFDNIVSRVQLIDTSNSGKLDIVAGTFAGKLFRVPNLGTSSAPIFRPTEDRDSLVINTRKKAQLWCNYLAPYLTTAFGSNTLDLLIGDGGYSANSIYLLHNSGTSGSLVFDEDHTQKMIPGMGTEDLTPCPVDWNNDGKVDVVSGDRTGDILLFLNTSTDPANPTFAPATNVSLGGVQKFPGATSVTVCDLSGNHLPNLLIGRDDGTLLYATNTGKLGSPQFGAALPLKGVFPPSYHYVAPAQWQKRGAYGMPYEMLGCVNPQLEPGFAFPEGVKAKYALKFWVWPYKSKYFPQRYVEPNEIEVNEHQLYCLPHMVLTLNKRYRLHFWLRSDGVANLRYRFWPDRYNGDGPIFTGPTIENPLGGGGSWSEITETIRADNSTQPTVTTWGYTYSFQFDGQGTIYVADISLQEAQ